MPQLETFHPQTALASSNLGPEQRTASDRNRVSEISSFLLLRRSQRHCKDEMRNTLTGFGPVASFMLLRPGIPRAGAPSKAFLVLPSALR